jgi:SAM-dependent methyltransferase
MTIDQAAVEEFVGRAVTELGAGFSALLLHIGDRLGIYRAMAGAGPLGAAELAGRTGTDERYLRAWLNNQAAGGYVAYDAGADRYELTPVQAACLADEQSATFVPGGFEILAGLYADEPRLSAAFRSGAGVGWHEHDPRLFTGTDRFFRPGYLASLTQEWIPALDGVEAKLRAGARVADVGCGYGSSSVILGGAYPNSRVAGFDYHAGSVEAARKAAAEAGVSDRVTFERAAATDVPGSGYDLVTFFDCLHDMGDPVAAARRAREVLAPDGTLMVVEPRAGGSVEENLNPVGRIFYAASALICTPCSLAQPGAAALGPQAGEERLTAVLAGAGFGRVRRAAETPFNLILEARP